MIRLFRTDGLELMLNVDMIKDINPGPVTIITLLSGEELPVKNSLTDVLNKIRAYRQGIENENREFDPAPKRNERPRKTPPPVRPAAENPPDAGNAAIPEDPQ
jgi:uncharacterized protein YlzI (FlbEa/FlbD family)